MEYTDTNYGQLGDVNIKYCKYISNYLKFGKSIDLKKKFIIKKNINEIINIFRSNKRIFFVFKYMKQNLELCKLIFNIQHKLLFFLENVKSMSISTYYNRITTIFKESHPYINFRKPKLCLQVLKTCNYGYKYINKQCIFSLLL